MTKNTFAFYCRFICARAGNAIAIGRQSVARVYINFAIASRSCTRKSSNATSRFGWSSRTSSRLIYQIVCILHSIYRNHWQITKSTASFRDWNTDLSQKQCEKSHDFECVCVWQTVCREYLDTSFEYFFIISNAERGRERSRNQNRLEKKNRENSID